MEWILKLAMAGGEGPCVDIMEISKPDGLGDIANRELTLTDRNGCSLGFSARSPPRRRGSTRSGGRFCPCCDGVCRVKDYRDHAVATLFGLVELKLPRFRCAA